MESIGTSHSSRILPGRAISPSSSFSSDTSSATISRKRSHEEFAATDTTKSKPSEPPHQRRRLRLSSSRPEPPPQQESMSFFSWARSLLFGGRTSQPGGTAPPPDNEEEPLAAATPEEEEAKQDATSEAATPDNDDDSVDGRHDHKTSGAATANSHDETTPTKKSTAAPPQQLPSPLASEDETPVRKVAPNKRSSSKNKGHHPAPDSDGAVPYRDLPEKPFNPKKPAKKAAGQILQRALKTRAKHGTLTTSGFRSLFSTQVATPGRGQIPKPMGILLSKNAKKEPPSTVRRIAGVSGGRIQKSKPIQRKSYIEKTNERTRRVTPGSTDRRGADTRLIAILQQINNESEREFRRLDEIRKRTEKINEEVERMRRTKEREVIPPLKGKYAKQFKEIATEVQRDHKRNHVKTYITHKFPKINVTETINTRALAKVLGIDGGGWLNDEAINFYLCLVSERENEARLRVIVFNSFFYNKLERNGYKGVEKWTKKRGAEGEKILDLDYIVVPINVNSTHWILAIINIKAKRFEIYDSMMGSSGPSKRIFQNLRTYMESESRGKANLSEWENYWNPDAPQQNNSSDCGVFTCKTAEIITRGGELTFRPEEILNQRHRMIIELVNARLLSTDPDDPESE